MIGEEQELSEEEEPSITEAMVEDELALEEEALPQLTGRQRLIIALVCAGAFLVALALFLPYSDIVRRVLSAQTRQASINFADLDLNVFGADEIKDLRIAFAGGSSLNAASVRSGLSWLGLAGQRPDGRIEFTGFELRSSALELRAASLQLSFDDVDIPAGQNLSQIRGQLKLNAQDVQIDQAPGLLGAFLTGERGALQSVQGELVAGGQSLRLRQPLNASGSLFTVRLDGGIQLSNALAASALNLNVCIRPAADLETRDPEMFQVYIFQGGAAGGELCRRVSGVLGRPQIEEAPTTEGQAPANAPPGTGGTSP